MIKQLFPLLLIALFFSVQPANAQCYVSTTLPTKVNGSLFRDGWADFSGAHSLKSGSCLTSDKVYKTTLKAVLQTIKEKPSYPIYDISQADNSKYCTCKRCNALANKYGGRSGLNIWFVNKIAKEVAKRYPGKKIGTLAYKYSRSAPVNIKPLDNVVIRLCNIECCFMHPLESEECPQNKTFMDELKAWHELTPNIYIWDYVVDFTQYLAPFPNMSVLAPNLRTFRKYGVIGIFEEGAHDARWGEFSELKHHVISKLLCNPDLDTETLAREFIFDYYGKAAKDIYQFYLLTQNLVTKDSHRRCRTTEQPPMYTQAYISQGDKLLNSALKKVKGSLYEARVKRVRTQILFLQYVINHDEGAKEEMLQILDEDPTNPGEMCKTWEDYIKRYPHVAKQSASLPLILSLGGLSTLASLAFYAYHKTHV